MSDADLLRMHTQGNKDAFGVLYQRHAAFDVARSRPQFALQDREPSAAAWPSAEADTGMDVRKQWLRLLPDHRAACTRPAAD
jgi:hypothetical protein